MVFKAPDIHERKFECTTYCSREIALSLELKNHERAQVFF